MSTTQTNHARENTMPSEREREREEERKQNAQRTHPTHTLRIMYMPLYIPNIPMSIRPCCCSLVCFHAVAAHAMIQSSSIPTTARQLAPALSPFPLSPTPHPPNTPRRLSSSLFPPPQNPLRPPLKSSHHLLHHPPRDPSHRHPQRRVREPVPDRQGNLGPSVVPSGCGGYRPPGD